LLLTVICIAEILGSPHIHSPLFSTTQNVLSTAYALRHVGQKDWAARAEIEVALVEALLISRPEPIELIETRTKLDKIASLGIFRPEISARVLRGADRVVLVLFVGVVGVAAELAAITCS
jgi:hypothetical protein